MKEIAAKAPDETRGVTLFEWLITSCVRPVDGLHDLVFIFRRGTFLGSMNWLDFDINVKGLNFDINEIFFSDCIILCTSLALLAVYLISFEFHNSHGRHQWQTHT